MIRPLGTADVDQFIAIRRESFRVAPLSFGQRPDVAIDRTQTLKDLANKTQEDFILGYFRSLNPVLTGTARDASISNQVAPARHEELAGILGMQRYASPKRSHRAFVWGVFVSPAAQGKGIGQQLLQECIRRARTIAGLERLILTVSHHAQAAIRMYEKEGFVVFGREPGAAKTEGVPMDEIYMMLDL